MKLNKFEQLNNEMNIFPKDLIEKGQKSILENENIDLKMSSHKTLIEQELVVSFLQDNFSSEISNFAAVMGGEGSQAYSFEVKEEKYIFRINKHYSLGFEKDKYAFVNFFKDSIPIPEIYKIGKINNSYNFCLSQRAEGKTLDLFTRKDMEELNPELFRTLDAIHAVDISDTKGYGKWNADGRGSGESWKEIILSVDQYVKEEPEKPSLFKTSFLEKDFWDKTYDFLGEMSNYCSEERYLVHGDYGSNNILADKNKITGVIDWENSMYGDFIFDIAWLSFWSKELDYKTLYSEYCHKKEVEIKNFNERLLCYQLYIGLGSLSFYAYSKQEDKYRNLKETIKKLQM